MQRRVSRQAAAMNSRTAAAGARLLQRVLTSAAAHGSCASTLGASTSHSAAIPSAACVLPLMQHRHVWTSIPTLAAQPQPETKASESQESAGAGPSSSGPAGGSEQQHGSEQQQQQQQQGTGASSSDTSTSGQGSLFENLAKEVRETVLPLNNLRSYTRKYKGPVAQAPEGPYTGTSAIAVVKQPQTPWQKAWSAVQDRLGHLPLFNKLSAFKVQDTSAFQKGQQLVEDLKEKYETSDHPMVHKVEEYKERVFAGSEASRAMMEIRTRDPSFDMNVFLRSIKLDAPVVTKAFLTHDMATLSDHCGPEIMQRLEGLCKAFQQQELREDPTILFVGDAEMVELRLMEGDPFLICQFHCQQLKCVRDKFGNVVEGSPDTIHRVYYFWGLQQERQGVVTASGELLPPRWVIKDMLWQSMLALV